TFYDWYSRYQEGGIEALVDGKPRPRRIWNKIPDKIETAIVNLALEEPDLSPRAWARVPAGIANARARSVAAPIANREPQKSTAEGRKCGQLFSVEREGGDRHRRGPKMRPTFFDRARGRRPHRSVASAGVLDPIRHDEALR